jgi:hypothetical protein
LNPSPQVRGQASAPPGEGGSSSKDQVAVVQRWRTVIDTQMHFNDMLMRTRTAGVSIVITVFGAAAVGLAQYPGRLISMPGATIHVAAIVIIFGLLLLAALFVMDYFYFYRMLIAVVRHGEEMEAESRGPKSPIAFNLTCCLSDSISRRRASFVLLAFYGIPFVAGLIFLTYLVTLNPT